MLRIYEDAIRLVRLLRPLWEKIGQTTGDNVLADAPGKLSTLGQRAVAGVVRAAPELSAQWAPTGNSYRRYAPGNWAARTATWAIGNYTCGLRVVADHPDDTRLELRLPGADASPHLVMAGLLAAALWGIETEQDPTAETTDVAYDVVDPDIGPIARDLADAAERLSASERARAWFGDAFVDHHAATRRAEHDALRRHVSAAERLRYLHDA
jgi:glutamine synthetase